LLFSLYINEIGNILDKLDIDFALFADDLTIWKSDEKLDKIVPILQNATDKIDTFFNKRGLSLNCKKCEYTIITNQKKPPDKLKITIKDKEIQYNENPKLLGITLDKKMNFNHHFDIIKKQLTSKINLLRIISRKSNHINKSYLLTVYKSLILSKLQYSMLPYMVTTRPTRKSLQLLQNKCLKIILNVPTQTSTDLIHQVLKTEKLDKRIPTLVGNYLSKAKTYNESTRKVFTTHRAKRIRPRKSERSILDKTDILTLKPFLSYI